jgi:Galactose oxidase, central domain/Kelch motif
VNTVDRNRPLLAVLALVAVLTPVGCARSHGLLGEPPTLSPTPTRSASTAPTGSASPSPSTGPLSVPVPTPGTWRSLAPAPVPAGSYQAVWTGTEMLVHQPNGRTHRGSIDAAYNPGTNTWRRLRSSPYRVQSGEGGTQIAWDGTELLTFGVMNAALNPATGRWRPLTAPPLPAASVVLWTGTRVLIWGGGCCGDARAQGAAYDPATDRWSPLPRSPLAGRHAAGVWTGTEMVIAGGQTADGAAFADAAAYNPTTRSWRRLPPLPGPRYGATLTWTGREVLVVGGQRDAASMPYADGYAYQPGTHRWRRLPAMDAGRSRHTAVWTVHHLIIWGGQTGSAAENPAAPPHGLTLNPATGRWAALPTAPLRARTGAVGVWTGTDMLIWNGTGLPYPYAPFIDGARYRP